MAGAVEKLQQISIAPLEKEAFDAWLEMRDAVAFLKDNVRQKEFVVYAGLQHTFMHAVLVPESLMNPPDSADLMEWNFNAADSWGICTTYSKPPVVSISPPLDHTGSKTIDKGEQLVFARSFEGRLGEKGYFEALQRFIHVFGLHFLEDRNAYCRLDEHGDVEEMIRIVAVPEKGDDFGGNIITFNRDLLDEYMALTDSVLVRTFDFTRYPPNFGGWTNLPDAQETTDGDLVYRSHIEPGHASFMRGIQIVRSNMSKQALIQRHISGVKKERKYASFIAYDWKNGVVKEISSAPGHTENYFTKSDLPFETSPAFFKPEVLSKYKADSGKYRLDARSIYCRGAWHLQTYDINESGQVHTYIVYLSRLPYEEQLYWKSYNEPPKGSISKRAFKTDFEASWDIDYDPLESLKEVCRYLKRKQMPWWTLRSDDLLDRVHYPVTSSADEWANEILQLDQLVVEGFETKWLRNKAQELERTPDPQFGSLKLVEECLIALGFSDDDAKKAMEPLKTLHDLRSKLKGHASGKDALVIKRKALSDSGSYSKHFRSLCANCDESIRRIKEPLNKLK
ncbi:MAG TPA: hypothetical protein VI636_08895 [Candidatus Angelobacter sp.]